MRLIPLLGRVPAGPLDIAAEDLEGYLPIQSNYASDELFGLRVRGESMTGVGILPGDILVVRRQPAADSGDIVVALVGDEVTVKRLRIAAIESNSIRKTPNFNRSSRNPAIGTARQGDEIRRYLERS